MEKRERFRVPMNYLACDIFQGSTSDRGKLIDLSGNGASFTCEEQYAGFVTLTFELEKQPFQVKGKIVRTQKRDKYDIFHALQYEGNNEKDIQTLQHILFRLDAERNRGND